MPSARKLLFWALLSTAFAGGIVIRDMSVTGALLAYQYQIVDWADARVGVVEPADERLPHTAEVLGVAGQTVAALASAEAAALVWTGFALAWRWWQAWQARSGRRTEIDSAPELGHL
jgi:uncharacterized iron-regulated membrane protein